MPEMRTPEEWCAEYGLDIADPDGWRHPGAPAWHEPITLLEFADRYALSTVQCVNPNGNGRFDADVKAARDA